MTEAMREAGEIEQKAQQAVVDNQRKEWRKHGVTMEEVAQHNHQSSAWLVIKDRVYDATLFLDLHPG
eukprot:CAMPEP_0195117420 /NCGR_PEP_ID=MMETSP0448-20130528/114300_1 /TAXON_ID=66468 /ORGANISM="Heterocapsa triquestra, Strain CCMP 448" /LENGTH=66 /DNA_ID=CAMNT_0040154637 /DNA_START=12 /DNA_END=209 /DNA_ORIENTATION=+